MDKQGLIKAAKRAIEFHKDAQVIHVTSDGQVFLEKAKSHALYHAKKLGTEVYTWTRETVEGFKTLTAKEQAAADAPAADAPTADAPTADAPAVDTPVRKITTKKSKAAKSKAGK